MNRSLVALLLLATLSGLLLHTAFASKAPSPFCKSKPLYHQFPMIQNETLMHDMSDSFSGYNLDIKLKSKNSFATIHDKLTQLDQKKMSIPGIISHRV